MSHGPILACADCQEPWPCQQFRAEVNAAFGRLAKALEKAMEETAAQQAARQRKAVTSR